MHCVFFAWNWKGTKDSKLGKARVLFEAFNERTLESLASVLFQGKTYANIRIALASLLEDIENSSGDEEVYSIAGCDPVQKFVETMIQLSDNVQVDAYRKLDVDSSPSDDSVPFVGSRVGPSKVLILSFLFITNLL